MYNEISASKRLITIGDIMAAARKKTPMKNKTKLWRRIAKKRFDGSTEIRNGRVVRNMMARMGTMKAMMLPIHKTLFDRAGISTPVLDNLRQPRYNNTTKEVVAETAGETNAVA